MPKPEEVRKRLLSVGGSSGAQTTRKAKKAHFEGFEFRYATICEENKGVSTPNWGFWSD
jgi:hypothetical protein